MAKYEISASTTNPDSFIKMTVIECESTKEVEAVLHWLEDAFEDLTVYENKDGQSPKAIYFREIDFEFFKASRTVSDALNMVEYAIQRVREEE